MESRYLGVTLSDVFVYVDPVVIHTTLSHTMQNSVGMSVLVQRISLLRVGSKEVRKSTRL